MKFARSSFALFMTLSLILCAAHAAAAEDGEEEQIEYVYVFEDGTEVRFYSDSELTEREVRWLAGEARANTEMYVEIMTDESYLDDSCYIPDQQTVVPSGPVLPLDGSSAPPHQHSYTESAAVTATKHYVFDDSPKCLECRFKVFTCVVCSAKAIGFESSRRVACHSGTVVKDWEIYDNYLYYNNSDGHKQDGYVTDSVTVKVRPLVSGKPDKSDFPGISRYVTGFEYDERSRTATIYFADAPSSRPNYTAGEIDRYVSCLKYLEALPYLEWMLPATHHDESVPEPQSDGGGEKDAPSDVPPQNEPTQDLPTPGDPEQNFPAPGDPVQNDPTPNDAPAPFVPARQDGAAPAENAAPQGGKLHNPPTGDGIVLLVAAAVFASLAIVISVKKYRSNKEER